MPRKLQISEITLQLTDKQRVALQNSYVTPQGLGSNYATYTRGVHEPLLSRTLKSPRGG